MASESPAAPRPPSALSYKQLARTFYHHYLGLAALAVMVIISEGLVPYRHVLYSTTDEEMWKYSRPLRTNTVPSWAVPTVAVTAPLTAIGGALLTGRISLLEAHHAATASLSAVMFTGFTTNFVKVNVGRFRPHFVARCWPNGGKPHFEPDGRPQCDDSAINPLEGMKSFPSGHTSWSTSGLGFLSFWLMGKLRCFAGGGGSGSGVSSGDGPHRLAVALLPLGGSMWIGASRLQDYWHHVEDVCVGFALGLTLAFLFYRTVYCSLMGPQAGCLIAAAPSVGGASWVGGNGAASKHGGGWHHHDSFAEEV